MPSADKYDTDDPLFDVEHGLLFNKLGITNAEELEHAEGTALQKAFENAALSYSDIHQFSVADVKALHRLFLEEIFTWAGEYRVVDISSADIRWCHAQYIPKEMHRIDQWLSQNTPFNPNWPRGKIVQLIAEIHGELIVIHPFRDGNGRTTRLLCDLLLMQSNTPPIRAQQFYEDRTPYFEAIQEVRREASYEKLIALLDSMIDLKPV